MLIVAEECAHEIERDESRRSFMGRERLIMMMMIHCAGNVSKQFVVFRQTIHNFSMVFHGDDFHFYSMKCELIMFPLFSLWVDRSKTGEERTFFLWEHFPCCVSVWKTSQECRRLVSRILRFSQWSFEYRSHVKLIKLKNELWWAIFHVSTFFV